MVPSPRWLKKRERRFATKPSITPRRGLPRSGIVRLASYLLNHSRRELTGCPLGRSTPLTGLAVAWTGHIQANSGDMRALDNWAEEVLVERVLALDPEWADVPRSFTGGLETILPASMGGKPGKAHAFRANSILGAISHGESDLCRAVCKARV